MHGKAVFSIRLVEHPARNAFRYTAWVSEEDFRRARTLFSAGVRRIEKETRPTHEIHLGTAGVMDLRRHPLNCMVLIEAEATWEPDRTTDQGGDGR